jgi:EAL domain-containing protein (putative c-di-GMP-specific phosphodiesterase class I)
VNISADDLLSADLAERVGGLLRLYKVPAEQLIFEITESAVMREPEHALTVLNKLRECGISLSVDDFGTGYSSLAHLKRLPVQELKIDQSFVRNLDETSEDAVIVRSTIEMSHNLGLKVVAEGVEYEHSLRLLERWHCDTAQGYLISRPLTAAAFETWMSTSTYSPSLMVH